MAFNGLGYPPGPSVWRILQRSLSQYPGDRVTEPGPMGVTNLISWLALCVVGIGGAVHGLRLLWRDVLNTSNGEEKRSANKRVSVLMAVAFVIVGSSAALTSVSILLLQRNRTFLPLPVQAEYSPALIAYLVGGAAFGAIVTKDSSWIGRIVVIAFGVAAAFCAFETTSLGRGTPQGESWLQLCLLFVAALSVAVWILDRIERHDRAKS